MKNKKIIVLSVFLILIVGILISVYMNYGVEYLNTVKKIKNSDTYNKNEVIVNYQGIEYKVIIPKGLGDLELKGNVRYCLKSQKSLNKLIKEFSELYGVENVIKKEDSKYIYTDVKQKQVVQVEFTGGIFKDVCIINVESLNYNN